MWQSSDLSYSANLSASGRQVDRQQGIVNVQLMGGFGVRVGGAPVDMPGNAQRLLALLAVRRTAQLRSSVSATLWPDASAARASANLRTALWKVRQATGDVIVARGRHLGLATRVEIDLDRVRVKANRILAGEDDEIDVTLADFAGDLLPDLDEEWIVFERERVRQLCIHALEALSRRLISARNMPGAIDVALAAVAAEPLRESAQRVLIEAHLGEGNLSEAHRQFNAYRLLLSDSLGVEPSIDLRELLR